MIVNAATILHLNQTAADYAYYLVKNAPVEEVAREMSARYHVSAGQASQDYVELAHRIQILIEIPDLDPVTFLDFERQEPFSGRLSAPYRLDCALTYRLPYNEPVELGADRASSTRVEHRRMEKDLAESLGCRYSACDLHRR